MRDILFLAHRVPWPPDRGDKIRSHHILRHLARQARVHLVTFTEGEDHAAVTAALAPMVASCTLVHRARSRPRAALEAFATGRPVSLTAFDSRRLRRAVDTTIEVHGITAAYVFSSQMAQYLHRFSGRLVMDFVDVDSAKFADYADAARGPMRWMMRREAGMLLAHDTRVAHGAQASLFVSEAEAALFRMRTGLGHIHAIENGIDTDHYDPANATPIVANGPLIVFTGQMDYRPNIDAVTTFARSVLPAIRAIHPDTDFAIVGRNPPMAVRALGARSGVTVTGAVADTRPWLAAATVVVAPLAIARGVQNKVLEAMAMARPVVVSPQAAEGIDHGGTIRVAAAADQARAVLDLIADPHAACAMGQAARTRTIARYGWNARLAALDPLMGFAS